MEDKLPTTIVPEGLRWLLDLNFYNGRKVYGQISDAVYKDPFLNLSIGLNFKDFDKKQSFEAMLNALGWEGFRDRLTSVYLYHREHKKFPAETNLELVERLREFEERYRMISPEGNSRIYVFALYRALCELEHKSSFGEEVDYLSIDPEVDELLTIGEGKTTKPDWLLCSMISLHRILGFDCLKRVLESHHGKFFYVFEQLDDDQQDDFIEELLGYGHSINDLEFFLFQKV